MQLKDNIKFTIDKQMSIGGEDCKNILIKGDNKAILPELVPVYRGKIKCIYIDPPYNNGDSYHYYNDNTTTSAWLKDMRSVLSWLKMLLKKDGSIWISIDDKEMAYLKVEADRIFGRENFASTIVIIGNIWLLNYPQYGRKSTLWGTCDKAVCKANNNTAGSTL